MPFVRRRPTTIRQLRTAQRLLLRPEGATCTELASALQIADCDSVWLVRKLMKQYPGLFPEGHVLSKIRGVQGPRRRLSVKMFSDSGRSPRQNFTYRLVPLHFPTQEEFDNA